MRISAILLAVTLLGRPLASAASAESFSFEEAVRMSDRIVVGTVEGTSAGSAILPNGRSIALGIKDPATGLVFTPYRVRIDYCLLDGDTNCTLEDMEVLIPGGTVYEIVDGEQQLRTWAVVGAAGVALPPVGEDVLLFLKKRNDRYVPLNDRGGRIPVDRSSGKASVSLRFASPAFLTAAARESAQSRIAAGPPATTRPEFVESVPLDRLKELIPQAREVPKPTSGMRHAIPDRTDSCASYGERERRAGLRSGEDS